MVGDSRGMGHASGVGQIAMICLSAEVLTPSWVVGKLSDLPLQTVGAGWCDKKPK